MRMSFNSLRVRLALAMLATFAVGCAVSSLVDLFEAASGPTSLLVQEPYQDLVLLVLFGSFCIPVIWLVSAWSLKGVGSAVRDAHAIGMADSPSRISMDRLPSEVRPLVVAFNSAMDRLSHAYDIERRFVADAAHQIRTPLAVLGLRLQKARIDGVIDWESIQSDLAVMNRLAEHLLVLSKKERARYAREPLHPLEFGRVAREAAASLAPIIEGTGRTIDVEIRGRHLMEGRADDLRDMIACLLENAVVHGRGAIVLSVEAAMPTDGAKVVRLIVADRGPGVDPRIGTMAFERFRKGPGPGSGLGLAIVKEVVDGHGGTIAILTGPGCRIEVVLPVSGGSVVGPAPWRDLSCVDLGSSAA